MKLQEIIKLPEGRRLEFKQKLPASADLTKTIVAFANDAGGDVYIGVQNNPRKLTGIPEDELLKTEEKIASIIHDNCCPVIVPDITFPVENGCYLIRVQIHRGSDFPYHLKSKGIHGGTYIRIGSTNRLADDSIIEELQRRKRNISFDSEPLHGNAISDFDLSSFEKQFKELSGENLTQATLKKLLLIKESRGKQLPTNALALFADYESRKDLFPYSKVECARFKGVSTETKMDDKTITDQIGLQPAEALKFVERHVDKESVIDGAYTKSRWAFPMKAIREVLRNAVAHRDYSLTGKDIKVAVYDDMVEILSPGTLLPSINFDDLEARQSDIRNKVIAPVFKHLGIIDQWGNGLKIISQELKLYPEIEFKWFETGLQFQVQFIKKDNQPAIQQNSVFDSIGREIAVIFGLSWDQAGTRSEPGRDQAGTKLALSWHQVENLLVFSQTSRNVKEFMTLLNWKSRTKFRAKYITPLLGMGLLQMTVPNKPSSPNQQYFLTQKGHGFLEFLKKSLKM
ncbi:MAG: RNA-binding domain-containing protein [Bacteroidales bacterium]|jgi:predicted HTH transcriptional regulator|nr:putative DNA binding domain-containing protein [Bacteroidales bacterium]